MARLRKIAVAVAMCVASAAYADGTFVGHITNIAPNVFPTQVAFKMDNGLASSPCAMGTPVPYIYYGSSNANIDNMKAVYAFVLAAWVSQQSIFVTYTNGAWPGGGCTISALGPN